MFVQPTPYGYPELGLVPSTLPLRWRADANLQRLSRRLERWEHDQGNAEFRIRGLERLQPDIAFELVATYVALREQHPAVRPELLDLAARSDHPDVYATAVAYPFVFQHLRARVNDADGCELQRPLDREERREAAYLGDTVSVHTSGTIELTRATTTLRGQRRIAAYWERRNAMRAATGLPCRLPGLATSPATFLLTHEFGHLIDGELGALGLHAAVPVYGAMSTALLGVKDPHPSQWRNHLINYPTGQTTSALNGPRHRDARMRRTHRDALGRQLAWIVGTYGPSNRDELFAETFALSYCSNDALRRQLEPFGAAVRKATTHPMRAAA